MRMPTDERDRGTIETDIAATPLRHSGAGWNLDQFQQISCKLQRVERLLTPLHFLVGAVPGSYK